MRLIPRSLHMRMLALSLIAMVVALMVSGWAMTAVLERFVISGLDQRLDAEIALLASTVDKDGHVDQSQIERRLGAFESGRGWHWRIAGPEGALASADFPALAAGPAGPPPPPPGGPEAIAPHPRPLDGARDEDPDVHARTLTIPTQRGPVTLTAAAPKDLVSRPILEARVPLLMILGCLAILLGAATLIQLRLGLRPIRTLRQQVAEIRRGARQSVDEDLASELQPLALELNALALDNDRTLATARQSAANLAHALKTPVATLALGLRSQPEQAAQVERIDAIIRHHLARARLQATDRRVATPLAPLIADLLATIQAIHLDKGLVTEADIDSGLLVAVDEQDAQELVGNLLDNAARHARTRIGVRGARDPADPRNVLIDVSDDGPGIPLAERTRMTLPGTRLDEQGGGHGFGLSIVRELAALYGGSLQLDEAAMGGLRAILTIPAAI